MKVSTKWLNEYVSINDIEVPALAEKIERTAVEIDNVVRLADGLKKIVVGHVLSVEDHPDSDHLHICQVEVGEEEPLQIVCGAPNVAAGQNVIVALPNSRIAGNVKIKKGKMRGVVSQGMLCGLQEIGFADSVVPEEFLNGIYVLPENAVPGEEVYAYLGMDEAILDLDLTPNRADLMSMHGVAHEIAAIYQRKVHLHEPSVIENPEAKVTEQVEIVGDEALAPTYAMRAINNITVKPSPLWLQSRLWNAGIRPVNNVIDATNYILLDYGQPVVPFDQAQVAGSKVFVRLANDGETIITADGKERQLTAEDIVIADENGPLALAGIMNGQKALVDGQTTDIILEAAVFNPTRVRKTSRREVLHTNASMRFERGINVATTLEALDAAAVLIAKLSGGKIASGVAVTNLIEPQAQVVEVTLDRINHVLGTEFVEADITKIFTALGFGVEFADGNFTVTIPARRWDITIASDLIEEVARIYGYDNLPTTLPVSKTTPGQYTKSQKVIRAARNILQASGLDQAVSYALTSEEKAARFLMEPSLPTKLDFPMSSDRTTVRMNLISGLLDDVAYNNARKVENVALYEQGRVFYRNADEKRPREVEHIAGALTGLFDPENWHEVKRPVDFYVTKGIVEQLLAELGFKGHVSFVASQRYPEMHPGRTADILVNGLYVGFIGEVHPTIQKEYRLKRTYVFEIDLAKLVELDKTPEIFVPVSKYPAIKRDIALEVAKELTNQQIVDCIKANGGAFLQDVQIFDVYEGEHIKEGFKSLAYNLVFQNKEATLTDEEVTKAFDKIVNKLTAEFNVTVR